MSEPAALQERRQLPALTGLRFFLALWVVVYHQKDSLLEWIASAAVVGGPLAAILSTGYAAVGFFFILSGFVLAYNYDLTVLRRKRDLIRFAIARFSRIYPAYLLGLILLIPFLFYRLGNAIPMDLPVELRNLALNLTLLQAWAPSAALTWNYPGWSLSNEAFFYAVFPFAGFALWRAGRRAGISGLLAIALGLWMLSLAAPLYAVLKPLPHFGNAPATDTRLEGAGWPADFVRYNPLLRLPDFGLGILLARIYRTVPALERWRNRGAILYIPGMIGAVAVLAGADRIPFPLLHNGLLMPAFALIILGLALDGGTLARILSLPFLVFLGNASYSMYILHVPVYSWLEIGFRRVLSIPAHGSFWVACYVLAVVLVSTIFYRFAEDPVHGWLKRRLNRACGTEATPFQPGPIVIGR